MCKFKEWCNPTGVTHGTHQIDDSPAIYWTTAEPRRWDIISSDKRGSIFLLAASPSYLHLRSVPIVQRQPWVRNLCPHPVNFCCLCRSQTLPRISPYLSSPLSLPFSWSRCLPTSRLCIRSIYIYKPSFLPVDVACDGSHEDCTLPWRANQLRTRNLFN